jgi:hypothetical protein
MPTGKQIQSGNEHEQGQQKVDDLPWNAPCFERHLNLLRFERRPPPAGAFFVTLAPASGTAASLYRAWRSRARFSRAAVNAKHRQSRAARSAAARSRRGKRRRPANMRTNSSCIPTVPSSAFGSGSSATNSRSGESAPSVLLPGQGGTLISVGSSFLSAKVSGETGEAGLLPRSFPGTPLPLAPLFIRFVPLVLLSLGGFFSRGIQQAPFSLTRPPIGWRAFQDAQKAVDG